jgi:hypothetical protein
VADQRQFSLRQVVITAFVGFAVSGLGGAYLNAYLSRPKPSIAVDGVGFELGENGGNSVPQELVSLSKDDSWSRDLNGTESLAELVDYERSLSKTRASLEQAHRHVDSWLNDVRGAPRQLDRDQIRACPLLTDQTVMAGIQGYLKGGSFGRPPVDLDAMAKYAVVLAVGTGREGAEQKLLLTDLGFSVRFDEQVEQVALRELAESLARGVTANLVFFHEHFLVRVGPDLKIIANLQDRLDTWILQNARLAIRLALINQGDRAAVFQPHFGIRIYDVGGNVIEDLALSARQESGGHEAVFSSLADLRDHGDHEDHGDQETRAGKFHTVVHSSVGPGQIVELTLLGGPPRAILDALVRGPVRFDVVAITVDGKPIWASVAVAGDANSPMAESIKELLAAHGRNGGG